MPESGWQKIQENTFRRWCTRNLKVRGMKIDDLSQDFSDGLLLIALLEVLSGKKFGPHDHNPKNRLQKLANCGLCVDFIKSEGVRIEFIGGVDIVDGNLQRILGLVWTLILHYQINLGFQPRQALLSWIQVRLPDKGIKNFTTDWNSGINLAALVDSVVPGLCSEHATMDASMPLQNAKLAMDRAEQRLNIPQILTPEELVNPKIDELSVMTYMSFFPECKPNEHVDEPDVGPNPLTWTADGPGIGKCVQANDETHFTVYPGIGKLSELQVKLLNTSQGRIEFPVEFEAIEDGTILVTYNTAEPGHYQIFILVAGLDITGSPYEVAVIDVTKVRVVMPERNLKVGDIVTCNVDASLAGPGQITANAVVPGGDERHCQITALSEGRYKAEVALNVPGEYMITVSLEGILVLTNPLVIADFHEPNITLEVVESKSGHHLVTLRDVPLSSSVQSLKSRVHQQYSKIHLSRIQLRLDARGKGLKDEETVESLGLRSGSKLYLKDLGPQIGWKTVFVAEYMGPLLIYPLFYVRPALIYGVGASSEPYHGVVQIAAACWTFHYAKRVFETLFIHRFSHGSMPLRNLFKNCLYYWGFACLVGYFVNHPLYTPPAFGSMQIGLGLFGFLVSEYGNFSIHNLLSNLRSAGSAERQVPLPSSNVFSWLFNYVSCPNYTYEVGAWSSFAVMTQTLTAGFFALVGFGQMAVWALGKHRNYKREFANYPKKRKAIIPFLL